MLVVHATTPADDEWLRCLDAVSGSQASNDMVYVVAVCLSPEAIPTTPQRTMVSARVDQARVRIALVGGGRTLRMVVKAFSLFYPQSRAFPLDGVDAALRYLDGPSVESGRRDLEELAKHFGRRLAPTG